MTRLERDYRNKLAADILVSLHVNPAKYESPKGAAEKALAAANELMKLIEAGY